MFLKTAATFSEYLICTFGEIDILKSEFTLLILHVSVTVLEEALLL